MAGLMGEAFAVRLDPVAWTQASGAGSVDDLGAWLGVCCREAGDVAERVAQLNAELDDLACQELSGAAARAWVAVAGFHAVLDTARRQVLAAAEANDVPGLVASSDCAR